MAGYPPFFPTPPKHEDQLLNAISFETEHRKQASWYFYLSEISLLRLRRRITNEIKNFVSDDGENLLTSLAVVVTEHEEQIFDWVNTLPGIISLDAPPEEDEICRFVLRVTLSMSTKSYENMFLSNLAAKGLQKHIDRINTNHPGFQHRHHGTFGMIVSCTRSALVLLAAGQVCASARRNSTPSPYQMPTEWQGAVQEVIHLNETWGFEALDLSRMVVVLNDLWYNWT
ncbi:hypothetical protein DE146DRAFT_742947 [Phaeosphaeria sp. MPI-PUGE-AT-0046c]|nr:hypothetical protein DE146DRAFT_742947 [Phaeosphaeria sp. MPI-PUGE-AT-0046c]